jgi:hypothetical protein
MNYAGIEYCTAMQSEQMGYMIIIQSANENDDVGTRTRTTIHDQKTRETSSSPTTSDLRRASTSPGLTACLSFANIMLADDDECTRVSSTSSGIVSRLSSERKPGTEGRPAWMARRPWNRSDPTSTEAEKEGVTEDLNDVLVTPQSREGNKDVQLGLRPRASKSINVFDAKVAARERRGKRAQSAGRYIEPMGRK